MSRASWTRVKQVFHEALERTDLERAGYVAAACGDDAELRAQVEALLAAHEEAGEFLASPTAPETDEITRGAGAVAAADAPEGPGSRIGPYKLLQKIGEGGFGVVYLAEQVEPVKRRVALKIIKVGMDTREVIARFEAERQALAMMEHPNIAKVLDAGSTGTGRPYFVMELVKGVPITEYCDANRLSTRERLELFVMVCNAVQHAHQKGVIHRDLKPSNVMVTLHDGTPVPKVIDFGIAKATAQQLTERTLFTRYGQFIGTPAYMSPEQAEMSGLEVDTRTDIYSLGVLLYELLTGTTPLDARALRRGAYFEVLRVLREEEPPRPSMRLSTLGEQLARVAERRRADPRALAKLIRGDLDWIAMKALEKDRTRRYDSASELARDIARYFDDEAVTARPPSAAYRLRKAVKKHRGLVGAAAAVLAAILLGGTIALWQGVQAQRQGELARASAILASATAAQDPLLKALLVDEIADVPDLPGKLAVLRDVANDPLPTTVIQPVERPSQWEYSADGRYVAATFRDGTARVWRTDGVGEPRVLRHPAPVHGVEFSPDGRRIATGSADGSLRIWDVDGTGMPVELPGHEPGGLWILRFSPDGERIAARAAGVITVWPADGDGAPTVLRVDGVDLNGPEWSPSGDRILAGGSDGTARIWSADGTGAPLELPGHGSGRPRGEFTPDGERIVVWGGDGNVRVAPADGATPPSLLVREDPALESFSVAPDGRHVVMGYLDGTVRVLPIDGTGEPVVFRPGAAVEHAELSRDGTRLLAGSWDGKVRAFRARRTAPVPHLDAIQPSGAVSFSGPPGVAEWEETYDGSQIAVGFWGDATIRTWRAGDSGEAAVLFRGEAAVFDARFSPDGEKIAIASNDGSVRVLSADGSGSPIVLAGHDDSSRRLAFSPDGSRLVTSSRDSTARIWRTDGTGDPIVLQHPGWVYSAAFSPDGNRVATASYDGRVRVWALRDPSSPVVVQEHEGIAVSVTFSPDGARVASGSWDGTARITAADGVGEPVVLRGTGDIWEVAFSPDGSLLATAADQGEVRIWHADGRGQVAELRGHQGDVGGIAFSPDGTRIATASHDGTARVWRVDGSDQPIVLRGHESRVGGVDFSPDGSRVVTASWDGTVRMWRVTWPALLDYVRAHLRACLTPEQRTRFLGESRSEASAAHAECERRLRGTSELQSD